MSDPDRRLRHALTKCATDHAPDPRVTVFDVTPDTVGTTTTADSGGETVLLSGAVLTDHLKARAVEAVEAVADAPVAATDVTVLERVSRPWTVTAPVAPVRGDPTDDAEQVTQVLYGAALTGYDREGEWRRVRTPDGYVGWVERTYLRAPTDIDADVAVATGRVDVAADPGTLYASTECGVVERSGESVRVRFRTGVEHSLPADALGEIPETATPEDVVETAEAYLGTEYVWGGMTVEGIDCSGLTWMSYRRNGSDLPRDADLQRRMGEEVDRDDLAPGDLLFFPGHVAMSLGGETFVHASGSAEEVLIESFDADDDRYNEDLDEGFELAKRLL